MGLLKLVSQFDDLRYCDARNIFQCEKPQLGAMENQRRPPGP